MASQIRLIYVDPQNNLYDDTVAIIDMIPYPGDIVTGLWGGNSYRVKTRTQLFTQTGVDSSIVINLEYK